MKDHAGQPPPPLTEPVLVPCLFCTGAAVEGFEGVTRLLGWVDLPALGLDQPERRIMVRMVLPDGAARKLATDMRRSLARAEQ